LNDETLVEREARMAVEAEDRERAERDQFVEDLTGMFDERDRTFKLDAVVIDDSDAPGNSRLPPAGVVRFSDIAAWHTKALKRICAGNGWPETNADRVRVEVSHAGGGIIETNLFYGDCPLRDVDRLWHVLRTGAVAP
jgi:hypothetical protein